MTLVTERAIQTSRKGVVTYLTYDNKKVQVGEDELVSYWFDRGTPEPGKMSYSPLFQDIITANMALFLAESNYDALVNLYGNPVLVRVDNNGLNLNNGAVRSSINFREKNRVVDLNIGGELYFLGLSEVNAAVLRERIASLTEWLENHKNTLIPSTAGERVVSATEVVANENFNRIQTRILVTRKNNNIESVLKVWLGKHYPQYLGESNRIKVLTEPQTSRRPDALITPTTELSEEEKVDAK
jgi:hypothetical protein